jgi:hypothetical protein
MSENENLLSKEEAAKLAGINLETIQRYGELGLLREYKINLDVMYSEEDIRLLFNSRIKSNIASNTPSNNQINSQIKQSEGSTNKDEELPRLQDILKDAKDAQIKDLSQNSEEIDHKKNSDEEISQTLEKSEEGFNFSNNFNKINDISSIELLEISRSLKDQIEILKEERSWLRKRIEKLEAQTEREQMLRMAESETLRTLILKNETKKPWSFLLSWAKPKEN